jgi:hypothetical protein
MNSEVKQKWLEALRSGKYKQGRRQLRKGDSFCCLGVLCDVVDNSKWEASGYDKSFYYEGCGGTLPDDISKSIPSLREKLTLLMGMNDYYKNSFEEIADYIEENL